jgi:hypothetical protein
MFSPQLWQLAFPNPHHLPAGATQSAVYDPVAGFVAGQFLFPERPVVRRLGRVLGASMPETAVNENGELELGENEIRLHAKGRARHSVRAAS